ncbi:hypothetical protein EOB59_03250 [Mesorhizobium sp. M7A.F.Ca.MR.176.00.0.0]|uniref:hypothetical protein n=1 Tax=Mesorhizobium sp. M7A.F.Ca.MR.176.00.0.0 TaxID=2496776 RepID=UPI000FD2EE4F|nr:hypothetical protein [Mesorhizobium sp. M7A.F.Ca.MR.176.00.0.0]RUU93334.1 hypothetical protein EOB59_03250 [Mesorhizobium sp. M7A.F.Ca.MR.176.00.0.0]
MGDDQKDGVRVEHIDGKWAVQIVEDGVTTQQLFDNEEFARSFAAGQSIRLNLNQSDGRAIPRF